MTGHEEFLSTTHAMPFLSPQHAESGAVRSKGEMCEAIGAKLLIDDSLKYALQVAGDAGIEVLLFGAWALCEWVGGGGGMVGIFDPNRR